MKLLILGATGLLGNAMFNFFKEHSSWTVWGTIRSLDRNRFFKNSLCDNTIAGVDVRNPESLFETILQVNPDVIINCIGITKQLADENDPQNTILINSLLPHRLAKICDLLGARLIHFSTDCIFSGKKGNYIEDDIPDAQDLYGRSKLLGEVKYGHTVTLRTSMIGHEQNSAYGLVEWFLAQKNQCDGFSKAVFSGLPAIILAQIVYEQILPRTNLSGCYHIAADPINKFDLLRLIADVYGKSIEIRKNEDLVLDRSLNADYFKRLTGYTAPKWPEMIHTMHHAYCAQK